MSTTTNTKGSNTSNLQFNPASQAMYNQLIQGGSNVLGNYIQQPFQGSAFNLGAGQSSKQALGASNQFIQSLMQQQPAGQAGNAGQGFLGKQTAKAGRAGSSLMSQGNQQNIMNAFNRQQGAIGTGLSFSPQLTGQQGNFGQSSTTGGMGSWFTPLLAGLVSSGADYMKSMGSMAGGGG